MDAISATALFGFCSGICLYDLSRHTDPVFHWRIVHLPLAFVQRYTDFCTDAYVSVLLLSPQRLGSMKNRLTFRICLPRLMCAICAVVATGYLFPVHSAVADTTRQQTIIIPASDFLYALPKGNTIADAADAETSWLFNNTGIVLKSMSNMMTRIRVEESGKYQLFVRSFGKNRSSFKVAVNDKVTEAVFGNDTIAWKHGGTFDLKEGPATVKITRIDPGAVVDVMVLTKDPSLKERDIVRYQLNKEVTLLKDYDIPHASAVKFGDVDGDGLTDFLVLARDYSAHVFDHGGKELWSWTAPDVYVKERSEFEAPGVLWDFNRDGKSEVVHWRMEDGKEWLVIAQGETGSVVSKVAWPTRPLPHVYNNFRLAIGKLTKDSPNEIVAFTDMGGTMNINAFSADLKPLWIHTEHRRKDHLGHYVYPVDLNKDGIDEVLVGPLLLNSKGKMIWNRFDLLNDNHDHADNYKFCDVDGDGQAELVTANSETGVFIFKGMSGEILWQGVAEHSQQIEAGKFLRNVAGVQVVVGGRTYGNRQAGEPYLSSQLFWFNDKGEQLFRWPETPLNGNPDFVKGDWSGNGNEQLFWFKFKINGHGQGELYFPDPVYHMFDFMGNGAEEVITLSRGKLRVYGSQFATHSNADRKKDFNYLKNKVVNHTHY